MCLFALSLHNLEEMMAEHGVMVDYFLSLALSRSLLRTPTFFHRLMASLRPRKWTPLCICPHTNVSCHYKFVMHNTLMFMLCDRNTRTGQSIISNKRPWLFSSTTTLTSTSSFDSFSSTSATGTSVNSYRDTSSEPAPGSINILWVPERCSPVKARLQVRVGIREKWQKQTGWCGSGVVVR